MRSYLSLIPISARVRRRQNRMTILCIVISVMLVTAVFSAADSLIQAEDQYMQSRHGSWHIRIGNLSEQAGEELRQRPDVACLGWSGKYNEDADQPYEIGGRKATLYGTDREYMTQLTSAVEEGAFPQKDSEVLLSANAKLALDVQVGSTVTVSTPAGAADFLVSGFGSDDREYYQGQTYLVGVYMTKRAFSSLMDANGVSVPQTCYLRFQTAAQASRAISKIQQQYSLPAGSIQENTAIMGLAGQSSNKSVHNIYGLAAIVFVLVLLAGIFMISGSLNSNIAQRTKFFGMLRCIGMSRRQVIRFVRLEALNWCKTAVPLGMLLGTIASWSVCAMLRYGIGGEFAGAPLFHLSPIGLISGALVGTGAVLLAAQSPARRAARVTPMAAISGNAEDTPMAKRPSRIGSRRPEWTLGVHHATASKKNLLLMTASFALSIVLFLCFSVGLEFARALMPSLRSWQPDITLNGYANALLLEPSVLQELETIPGVTHCFGTAYLGDVPAASSREGAIHVSLISYSNFLLNRAEESVMEGDLSTIYGSTDKVMTVSNQDNPLKVGDTLQIGGKTVTISCALSSGIWPSEYSVICSQETFAELTGEENYSLVGIQLGKSADEDTLRQISRLAGSDIIFADNQENNRSDAQTYLAACFVLYSFVAILAVITLFYMMNSISMSVNARIRQYGVMRAIGMDGIQLTGMVCAEAFAYALSGLIVGCCLGLLLSRFLHQMLLTRYFGIGWEMPVQLLGIILVFDFVSAAIAAYAPAKRIRNMAITATINEL